LQGTLASPSSHFMQRAILSIIIPTYHAMPELADCLAALVEGLGTGLVREAIVVDGGSSDASVALATDMGCRVIVSEVRGRGHQLHVGAQAATGEWLLFLHADTVLSAGWSAAVLAHVAQSQPHSVGYFKLAFSRGGGSAQRVAALANWRAAAFGLPYGDAGLLIRAAHYHRLGGYRPLALMEDVDLVRRIGKAHLRRLESVAATSPVKFERGGWWRMPLRNLTLLAGFLLGIHPTRLARWYK
jgi:rSAM/selenodomain-associated transferase 2